MSIITIVPTYFLAIYSAIIAFKTKNSLYESIIFVILFAYVLQVIQLIDFDFRYRAPIFLLLILLGSLGVKELGERISYHLRGKNTNHGIHI